jgi:hypothetical protein
MTYRSESFLLIKWVPFCSSPVLLFLCYPSQLNFLQFCYWNTNSLLLVLSCLRASARNKGPFQIVHLTLCLNWALFGMLTVDTQKLEEIPTQAKPQKKTVETKGATTVNFYFPERKISNRVSRRVEVSTPDIYLHHTLYSIYNRNEGAWAFSDTRRHVFVWKLLDSSKYTSSIRKPVGNPGIFIQDFFCKVA